MNYFWGFNVYIIVDLVKHCVLTFVSDIWCFRMASIIIIITDFERWSAPSIHFEYWKHVRIPHSPP